MVTVVVSDGVMFTMEQDVASQCGLIADFAGGGGDQDEVIPVPVVNSNVMRKVIEYCEHHRNDPPQPEVPEGTATERKDRRGRDGWDAQFIQVEQELLFEIILAANYLNIKPLLDLGCSQVAQMMKGKTPEEIRKLFNIMNSFTTKQEPQVRAGSA